jgi:nicotinate-nucleotide pyrophosphorylase (carboxylating)
MSHPGALDPQRVSAWVAAALDEDAARQDATVAYLALGEQPVNAEIRVAQETVVSGGELARETFRQIDTRCRFDAAAADGERVAAGGVLAQVHGPARSVVSAERTALNFLQRMCGIATHAAHFVAAVSGTGVQILDTRKTTPLWRDLEKYAVRCGGAHNHRRDLGAMVLVKDNHVRALGGRDALLRVLDGGAPAPFVEVEVDSVAFLRALLGRRVDRVMLDNFAPTDVVNAVRLVEEFRRAHPESRLELEVSGGVTLETVRSFALPGVDFISVGALTHSAPAAPMSLEVL